MKYPMDENGNVLRSLASSGNDMSKPMTIDFAVVVPGRDGGEKIAESAIKKGYSVDLGFDDADGEWTCCCSKTMVPGYDDIIAAQKELNEISKPHGGYFEGWGTTGNRPV